MTRRPTASSPSVRSTRHGLRAEVMSSPVLIDEELAEFLQSGISMHAASAASGNIPQVTRAAGCRVSSDRRTVTVYMVESQARELLADVRANGRVAVAFTKPKTHRTVQLKG